MTVRWRRIKALAQRLLRDLNITTLPVPIETIASAKGLTIRYNDDRDSDISGFLLLGMGEPTIGVNTHHPLTRQRFTIAHELGHFLLHRVDNKDAHVDYGFQVKLRDDLSAQGTDVEEREANSFAAEILMPADFLERDLRREQVIDFLDEGFINNLARDYGVSSQAMTFRLANLRYVTL